MSYKTRTVTVTVILNIKDSRSFKFVMETNSPEKVIVRRVKKQLLPGLLTMLYPDIWSPGDILYAFRNWVRSWLDTEYYNKDSVQVFVETGHLIDEKRVFNMDDILKDINKYPVNEPQKFTTESEDRCENACEQAEEKITEDASNEWSKEAPGIPKEILSFIDMIEDITSSKEFKEEIRKQHREFKKRMFWKRFRNNLRYYSTLVALLAMSASTIFLSYLLSSIYL